MISLEVVFGDGLQGTCSLEESPTLVRRSSSAMVAVDLFVDGHGRVRMEKLFVERVLRGVLLEDRRSGWVASIKYKLDW